MGPNFVTPRKILFVTGTRADFGKMKALMLAVDQSRDFECCLFVTGMHMLHRYGATVDEVRKAGFRRIHTFINQYSGEPMELALSNTINGLSRYVHEDPPDLIIVHGDRLETLAGAIVGALRNILVGHIEGGELSGTVDELIRHSVSKLSHLHFVANNEAANRLLQMGELPSSVFITGSPNIDIMLSDDLPTMEQVLERYQLPFTDYSILIFHPVTTELDHLDRHVTNLVDAVIASNRNFVVIYPNNDEGSSRILQEYTRLERLNCIRMYPSFRFEYFLTLMKNAHLILGNSSAGIREAPYYSVPTVNVGTRQMNRYRHPSIIDVGHGKAEIVDGIRRAGTMPKVKSSDHFGRGNSLNNFMRVLADDATWAVGKQKQFNDVFT